MAIIVNREPIPESLYPPNAYTTSLYNAFCQAALLSYAIARNNTTCWRAMGEL